MDIDGLQMFNNYKSFHTWTSATVLDKNALIVTKKMTTMVTLVELESLTSHLGLNLEIEPGKNGRLWIYKDDQKAIVSNKDFGEISTRVNTTVCQVQKDVLSFHTQLKILLNYAQHIHNDFSEIDIAYPTLKIWNNTCFMGKNFETLMKMSLEQHKRCIFNQKKVKRSIISALLGDNDKINDLSSNMQKAMKIQDSNFNKIYDLDKSLVHNLNALLKNERTHDKDIRILYQLFKSIGHHYDQVHYRAIYFNIRSNLAHSLMHELKSLDLELTKLKDAIHHTTTCTFSQCIVSRHLHKKTSDQLVLTEHIQKFRLNKNYLIQCLPISEHKISSLHNQIAHIIDENYLVLENAYR